MKNLIFVLAAFSVLSVIAYLPSGNADYASSNAIGRTCSGQMTGPSTQLFFFGFTKEDGFCATRPFSANNYGEANDCAQRICPNCRVEDITGRYSFTSAFAGQNNMQGFCPARTQ